ncbi:hypothetical protein CBL_09167 [Carabus blaptoides fortunei]
MSCGVVMVVVLIQVVKQPSRPSTRNSSFVMNVDFEVAYVRVPAADATAQLLGQVCCAHVCWDPPDSLNTAVAPRTPFALHRFPLIPSKTMKRHNLHQAQISDFYPQYTHTCAFPSTYFLYDGMMVGLFGNCRICYMVGGAFH